MISFMGDHHKEIINFRNGMCVKIDFGDLKRDDFGGFMSCRSHKHRRIKLFDENDNLISETIEENPFYIPEEPKLSDEFFENSDPKILY
jgi:hypothetical protein